MNISIIRKVVFLYVSTQALSSCHEIGYDPEEILRERVMKHTERLEGRCFDQPFKKLEVVPVLNDQRFEGESDAFIPFNFLTFENGECVFFRVPETEWPQSSYTVLVSKEVITLPAIYAADIRAGNCAAAIEVERCP